MVSFDDSDSEDQIADVEVGSEKEEEANEKENGEEHLRDIDEEDPTTAIVPFTQLLSLSVSTSLTTPMTGSSSVSLSTGEGGAPKSSGPANHDSNKSSYQTSERIGYTENELILQRQCASQLAGRENWMNKWTPCRINRAIWTVSSRCCNPTLVSGATTKEWKSVDAMKKGARRNFDVKKFVNAVKRSAAQRKDAGKRREKEENERMIQTLVTCGTF